MDLEGKTAIVTGGARGIGRAVAEKLASEGAFVFVADLDIDGAKETTSRIERNGLRAKAVMMDLSSATSIRDMIAAIAGETGRIDILVNNAGIFGSNKPIDQLGIDDWDKVIGVNLRGTHICSQAVIKEMLARKSGKIVNVGSMSAQTGGLKAGADYTASKGGIHALTKAYARYGAPHGITVNTVVPGFILTDMTRSWAERPDAGKDIPMGRVGTVEEVANVVYFLSSPLSDYVTGQVLNVNGGVVLSN